MNNLRLKRLNFIWILLYFCIVTATGWQTEASTTPSTVEVTAETVIAARPTAITLAEIEIGTAEPIILMSFLILAGISSILSMFQSFPTPHQ